LKKAIKKDPMILQKDTVTVVDTIVTPPVELTDTVVLQEQDTLVIEREKLKVKIIRAFDTIRVDATCESDTIVSIVEVPYEKVIYTEKESWWDTLAKQIVYFLLVALGIKLLWDYVKPKRS
jgi:hypothetical protein